MKQEKKKPQIGVASRMGCVSTPRESIAVMVTIIQPSVVAICTKGKNDR